MIALTPAVRMIFTFMQMYFIFLNSKMAVYKLGLGAQFGLMHMIGTNLCVWLNVLVQETRHEILMFYNPDNGTITYPSTNNHHNSFGLRSHGHGGGGSDSHGSSGHYHYPDHSSYHHHHDASTTISPLDETTTTATLLSSSTTPMPSNLSESISVLLNTTMMEVHHRSKRGLKGPYSMYECRRSDIMGALVQNASPFLFPCTIEYSLICAAILYVMWKSMAVNINTKKTKLGDYHNGELHLVIK
jgi:hypothetical protein